MQRALTVVMASGLLLAGCGGDASSARDEPEVPSTMRVTSTAFGQDESIPVRFTCDGDEVSPPLAWSGVPASSAALALVVDDPDAPSGTFIHWAVYNIDPAQSALAAGEVPTGASQAKNSGGGVGYTGPCPRSGTHHYRFTVVALDAPTGLDQGSSLDDALAAVDDHAIASGTLTGTYSRD